jgi:hypothetical protein
MARYLHKIFLFMYVQVYIECSQPLSDDYLEVWKLLIEKKIWKILVKLAWMIYKVWISAGHLFFGVFFLHNQLIGAKFIFLNLIDSWADLRCCPVPEKLWLLLLLSLIWIRIRKSRTPIAFISVSQWPIVAHSRCWPHTKKIVCRSSKVGWSEIILRNGSLIQIWGPEPSSLPRHGRKGGSNRSLYLAHTLRNSPRYIIFLLFLIEWDLIDFGRQIDIILIGVCNMVSIKLKVFL